MVTGRRSNRRVSLEEALTSIALLSRPAVTEVDRRLGQLRRKHGDEAYTQFLQVLCSLTFTPEDAVNHWREIVRHTRGLSATLGRPVDYRVGAADYFISKDPQLHNPKLIDFEMFHQTQESSVRDYLTGLFNFRYLKESLPHEIGRAQRLEQPFSLVFIDIDFFKAYNDRFGHSAGNDALQQIAACVQAGVRDMDVVCRFGGEELTVLLPASDKEGATRVAQRLIERIALLRLPSSGPLGVLTASAGVATFPLDASSAEELLHAADAALYQAKAKGKNRVEEFARDRRLFPRAEREFIGASGVNDPEPLCLLGVNISLGGVFLESPSQLQPGNELDLALIFPLDDHFGRVTCRAHVVRCNQIDHRRFGVGARFSVLDAVERRKLVNMATLVSQN
jgi:diguanylate cyclase (GGDEF)-like protein